MAAPFDPSGDDTVTSTRVLLPSFNGSLSGGGSIAITTFGPGPSYGLGGDYLVAADEGGCMGSVASPVL